MSLTLQIILRAHAWMGVFSFTISLVETFTPCTNAFDLTALKLFLEIEFVFKLCMSIATKPHFGTLKTEASSMGTFVGHIVPGLALVLLGIWHTMNTVSDYYLKGSVNFVSSFWYPFKSPLFKLKHLELLSILSFSVFAIFMQVMDYPFLHFSFKFNNFEHATMFIHLAIFSGFTLCAELTHPSGNLSGVSGILASSVFGQELFLLHYHSADHIGLEGHYHWLLQVIVFGSLISSLSTTSFPSSFPAALVLVISVVFQGCWFLNMGFMLWFPKFVPQGCVVDVGDSKNMHGAVTCLTREAGSRAMALANMQFSWILAGVMIFTSCVCLKYARNFKPREESTVYEQLHSTGANVSVAIVGFKASSNLVHETV